MNSNMRNAQPVTPAEELAEQPIQKQPRNDPARGHGNPLRLSPGQQIAQKTHQSKSAYIQQEGENPYNHRLYQPHHIYGEPVDE